MSEDYVKGYHDGVADMEASLERADELIIDLTLLFVDNGSLSEEDTDAVLADLKEYLVEYCTVEHKFDEEYFNGMPPEQAVSDRKHWLHTEEFMKGNAYTLMEGELFADWMQRHGIKPANEEDYLNYTRIFTRLVNDMKDDSLPEAVPVDEVEPSIIKIFDVEYHEVVEEEEEEKNEWDDVDIPF